jgi:chromosome segregation ATPase
MAPVNKGASVTDVDNEITAELPVLDVAAYEATMNEAVSHTDTWVVPGEVAAAAVREVADDATAIMPKSVPTLPAYDLDHSGTHEMPIMPPVAKGPKPAARPPRREKVAAKPAPAPTYEPTAQMPVLAMPAAAPAAPAVAPASAPSASGSYVVPPSPPLIEELRGALATADRRIQELGERSRIADAERNAAVARANAEAAQLREQLNSHLEGAASTKSRGALRHADDSGLEDELFARADRIAALEKTLAQRDAALAETRATLEAALRRGDSLDCDLMNQRNTVKHRNAHILMLEADLAARQEREAKQKAQLVDALASQDPNVPHLRAEIAERNETIRALTAELAAARTRAAERDEDLQVAEESIRNLEIEVRDKSGKLEEASVTVEEWRAVIAESQRSIAQRDNRIQQLETDLERRVSALNDSAAQTGEEIALEGAPRVLIRTDGNTDFVHVLGRRTRIGRGPDNELVLDTKHVSRYHAVLLAGPVNTTIEDLNSTNGVFVNSKRVARQVLKDGDRVTVGRTTFRYAVRSS